MTQRHIPSLSLLPSVHPLVEPHKLKFVKRQVRHLWGLDPKQQATYQVQRMPAMNPVSLERQHLRLLKASQYVVAEKTDGVRFLLMLTCWPKHFPVCGGEPTALMFNRRYDTYEIRVMAPSTYFTRGTLLDGELAWEHVSATIPRQLYLIFDGMRLAGRSLVNLTYLERYQALQEALDLEGADILQYLTRWLEQAQIWAAERHKIICEGNAYALKFQMKPIFMATEIDTVSRQTATLRHASDGLILTPIYEPVHIGTHHTCFKFKEFHTMDLLWCAQWDQLTQTYVHELRYATAQGLQSCSEVGVRLPWPTSLERLPWVALTAGHVPCVLQSQHTYVQQVVAWHQERKHSSFQHIVEGTCDMPTDYELILQAPQVPPLLYFRILHIRYDKDRPNDKRTVERTLVNMAEKMTLSEVAAHLKSAG